MERLCNLEAKIQEDSMLILGQMGEMSKSANNIINIFLEENLRKQVMVLKPTVRR
jgi:hypothetical protein